MNPAVFGARIRQAREQLGMSQEQLAESVSKDQRAISEYENGKRKLSALDLPAFAHALNVPLSYFYGGEVQMDDMDRVILHEFQQLPTTQAKQTAIQIVRVLSDAFKLDSG